MELIGEALRYFSLGMAVLQAAGFLLGLAALLLPCEEEDRFAGEKLGYRS